MTRHTALSETLFSQKIYWLNQLSGELPETNLLADYLRPILYEGENKSLTFELPDCLSEGIIKLAKSSYFSIYLVLLAALKLLLNKYTGNDDIIVGMPIYPQEGNENLTNKIIPLRSRVKQGQTFKEFLLQVKDTTIGAYSHQTYAFDELIRLLQLSQNQNRCSIFDIVVLLENLHGHNHRVELNNDITVSFLVNNHKIQGKIEYNESIFRDETIKILSGHYLNVIECIVENINVKVFEVALLNAFERQQLLENFNRNTRTYPVDSTLNELFERQVEQHPNQIAVVCKETHLTYQDLNVKANQLARFLQDLGVRKGEFVGILKERDINFSIALLAILKVGGIYVPIDNTYPLERIRYMLANSEVRILLTDSSCFNQLIDLLDSDSHLRFLICLDVKGNSVEEIKQTEVVVCDRADFEKFSQENLTASCRGVDPAYMLYTSGSTGLPKGAIIRHGGAINHIYAQFEALELPEGFSFLQTAPASSDISVWQFLAPILRGGRTIIVDSETVSNPEQLFKVIQQEKLTLVELVPIVFKGLLDHVSRLSPSQRSLPNLKWMMVTGESVSVELVNQWLYLYPEIRVVNAYGPTEAADDIVQSIVEKPLPENLRTVPIGKPLANLNLYILDRQMQLVPIGVPGEICVSGYGVGQGYWKNEAKTNSSFVPNPFPMTAKPLPGTSRDFIYKTGDLGRWLPDGTIEFLGRIDRQVKIRGFRIELEEIESLLSQHPAVRETAVTVQEDVPNRKYLVAYIVPRIETQNATSSELVPQLRHFLQQRLPEHAIPSAFVRLEALPLTPNGKIDRRSLPAPELNASEASYVQPQTPTEETVAQIWAEVLGVELVGANDNFFELGGHSLLATQVMSRLRKAFPVELPLRSLFEFPTVAALSQQIQAACHPDTAPPAPPLLPVSRSGELPLSFAQQRLWFLTQLEPHSPFYNIHAAVRLKGSLNVAALEQSFNEIIRRHEVLRTTFQTVEGQPVLAIALTAVLSLPVIDLSELPPIQREATLRRLALAEAQQPFALDTSPMLRVTLLRVSHQEHVMLLTMHHIASDGWSMDVLVREVAALYQAFCSGQPSPLPLLPIQYVDFAAWQRQWLQGEVLEAQLAYWRQHLDGAPAVLELPTDRRRPAIQTFRGSTYSLKLSQSLNGALKTLSQQQGSTLFMTLLTAFKILLYRYTGSEDIVVGSPIANRNRAEIEGLIGFFVNTLALRTNLSGNPTYRELLGRVREVALGAYAHQDLPFEQLVKELQLPRDLSHTPVFQVMFVLQNTPMSVVELSGLTWNPLESESGTAKFDLTVYLEETAAGLIGTLEYNTDLFEAGTISRMAGHLQTLLEGIVANPEQHLSELPLLTPAEQNQLLREWNQKQVEYPQAWCIHQLIESQVERSPDAVAVVFEDQQLTYRQLNQQANQLAHYLIQLGVGPEVLVGICVERSIEMLVGLLGVLKAGGAYVPLDPAYPPQRLAYILENTQLPVLLTQQRLVNALPPHTAKVVCLDTSWENIAPNHQENPLTQVTSNNLAYVIYTSGSTGKPKGVQIPHGAVVNFLNAMSLTVGLTAKDILLSVTTLSFDIAALELYLPLMVGARLVVVSREVATDATELSRQLNSSGTTVMQATPATWRMLLGVGWQGSRSLKILCGGEALDRCLANQLRSRCNQLWNLYGPTETTIWSAAYQVESQDGVVGLGRPLANTQFYILDSQQQLVPVGVVGELYIGGAGLARGYFNQPQLTTEKFIPNPFDDHLGARLYKSGDLVRYRPDGTIEYLGRTDHQVKVRGFRIELGEIEAVLSEHPTVQATAVVVREDVPGDPRLVAYTVMHPERSLSIADLRRFLAEKLPQYMVPSAFVRLEALPLTPNGKVDRRTLPTPELTSSQASYVKPQTPTEETVAQIWAKVLGLELVGATDNFFELGGHSLLATQVMSRLGKAFPVELPLRSLFEFPTVAALSQQIQAACHSDMAPPAPPIKRVVREGEIPLSLAQARLWFIDQLDPGNSSYNIFVAVRLTGTFSLAILEQSLNEVVRRHEILRTNFIQVNGQPVQVISPTLTLTIPIINIQHSLEQEQQIQQLAIAEANKPFNLNLDPLLRISFLQIDPTDGVLVLTMHHIISDGWSMGVLLQEITTLYQAFSLQQSSPLPELSIQYADFAVWQRQWLQGEVLQTQLDYWQQQLGHNLPTLKLPTDRPRLSVQTFRGARKTLVLTQQLSKSLKDLSASFGGTLFMTLLAVFQVILHYLSGQDDIVVGTDVANRNRSETEGLIGFFVNQLVLRTNVSGNPSFPDLLARVRQVTLDAYAHQDLPFDKLVEALNPERDLSRTPLFQVKFVLQNAPMPSLEFGGLTLQPLDIDRETSRFDLLLNMTEMDTELVGSLEYNTDLFNPTTMARFLGHFEILLNHVVSNPDVRLNALKEVLVGADEQQRNMKEEVYQESVKQKLMQVKRKSAIDKS